MQKYAKVIDSRTGIVEVGLGSDIDFYKSIGMSLLEVEKAYDNQWYLISKLPSQPLEDVKKNKFAILSQKHHEAEKTGVIQSSLGFPIDANERANRDVSGLISQMEMTNIDTTQFCDANNDFHEVTLDNLKIMQLELIQYAQSLYATKWQFRAAIEAAKTVDELNAIDIKFVTDFTPAPITLAENASH